MVIWRRAVNAGADVAKPYFERRAAYKARGDHILAGMLFWIAAGFTAAIALIWAYPPLVRALPVLFVG